MLPAPADGSAPGFYGVYPAIVTDLVDPDSLGRIEVRFPFLGADGDRDVRAWATLCTPYADDNQGLAILPEVDSQVVVAFEAGNLRRPYIVGSAWNGTTTLPHDPEQANNIRLLRTRADSRLEFDDTAGAPKITVSTASGHEVVLDDGAREITIRHATGCVVRLTDTVGRRPGERERVDHRAQRGRHVADVDVQRRRAVPDAGRRGRRRLARVHPRRREHLVTGFVLRAPWYVRERDESDVLDPQAFRPAIQMYDGTDFVKRLMADPRDSLKSTTRRLLVLPGPGDAVGAEGAYGQAPARHPRAGPDGAAQALPAAATAGSTRSSSRCSATDRACRAQASTTTSRSAS